VTNSPARDETGWGPLVPIAMVMFIIALDTTMLNVAIPSIVADLGTTTSAVQSAVALYSLVMAALMVGAGRVADIVGSKRLYVVGLIVFGVGTLTATVAPNVVVLIVGWSVLEGIGAAALIPISIAMISTTYGGARRVAAFASSEASKRLRPLPGRSSAGTLPPPCRGGWRSPSKPSSSSW
jgi:MFS family permease